MSTPYFESADEAAAALAIPLLIAASSESAVPRAASKLSDLAVETMLGGRLYHRLRLPEVKGGQTLWVCAPHGSQEYLAWAIAIAEHAAGFGRSAFLLDAGAERPLGGLIAGRGLDLPAGVRARIEALGYAPAAGWASDLAGVRVVLPVSEPLAGAAPADPERWSLIVARSLPEDDADVPATPAATVDGIVLVAAIRDHAREELIRIGNALRSAKAPLLGLIALGPVSAPKLTPLERWNRIDPWALADRAGAEAPAAPPPPSVEEAPKEIEPEREPIALGPAYEPPRRNRTGFWALLLVLLVAGTAAIGQLRGWWRIPGLPPSHPAPEAVLAGGAPDSTARTGPVAAPDTAKAAIATIAPDSVAIAAAPIDSSQMRGADTLPEVPSLTPETKPSWPDTFVVHVNSFNHPSFAEREADRLRGLGLPVRVVEVELAKRGRWYRVVVGAFPDSAAASAEATLLKERQLVSFAQILGKGGRGNPRKSSPQ